MSYGPGRSPLVTGTVVGVGVWLVGYLVAVVVVETTGPVEGFSQLGVAAAIYVIGVSLALLSTTEMSVPLAWLVPTAAGLVAAVAGGAIVVARTERATNGWRAVKIGAAIALGVFLCTMVVLAVYLVPSTPFSNVPLPARYMGLIFGSLLFPALLGGLGGAIQHSIVTDEPGEKRADSDG